MKIGIVLEELHRSENELGHALLELSERHKVDHEIHHVARDLAAWSQEHVRKIAEVAKRYGQDLEPEPRGETALMAKMRDEGSEMIGRRGDAGLLLLRDLREVYLKASGVSADWEMLAQAAQGIKHTDLLEVAQVCHPQNVRQMKWANGKIKESSTQVLIS